MMPATNEHNSEKFSSSSLLRFAFFTCTLPSHVTNLCLIYRYVTFGKGTYFSHNLSLNCPIYFFRGLDYSSPWHDTFLAAQKAIQNNLWITHQSMQTVLQMCHSNLSGILMVDLSKLRY